MNDLRSPLEDRPFRPSPSRSDERVIATSEYYRTKFGSIRQSRWFPLASVVVAVVAFSGIVSYAYKQGSQSGANATTPIIEASNETVKQKPENPGGMEVPFQDAVVFDQLQKTPDAKPKETVENLLAPPEQPVASTTAPAPAQTEQQVTAKTETTAPAATTDKATPPAKTAEAAPSIAPPSEAVVTPPEATTPEEQIAPKPSETLAVEKAPTPAETAAPAATETLKDVVAKTAQSKPEEVKKIAETAPASAPAKTKVQSGTYRIQLGAFRDQAAARAAWAKFQKEFSAQLSGVTPDFPRADLGAKGTFYRVQGTKLSKASADELCRTLNAAKAHSCMVVK